jgi:hypothetical protein
MPRSISICVTFSSILFLAGCSSGNAVRYFSPYSAKWVRRQIQTYEMPANDAASRVARKVIYDGKPGYLIPSPCCDKFDYLYDTRGAILCAPSGGFTGRGDGSCPEALRTASARE